MLPRIRTTADAAGLFGRRWVTQHLRTLLKVNTYRASRNLALKTVIGASVCGVAVFLAAPFADDLISPVGGQGVGAHFGAGQEKKALPCAYLRHLRPKVRKRTCPWPVHRRCRRDRGPLREGRGLTGRLHRRGPGSLDSGTSGQARDLAAGPAILCVRSIVILWLGSGILEGGCVCRDYCFPM